MAAAKPELSCAQCRKPLPHQGSVWTAGKGLCGRACVDAFRASSAHRPRWPCRRCGAASQPPSEVLRYGNARVERVEEDWRGLCPKCAAATPTRTARKKGPTSRRIGQGIRTAARDGDAGGLRWPGMPATPTVEGKSQSKRAGKDDDVTKSTRHLGLWIAATVGACLLAGRELLG